MVGNHGQLCSCETIGLLQATNGDDSARLSVLWKRCLVSSYQERRKVFLRPWERMGYVSTLRILAYLSR